MFRFRRTATFLFALASGFLFTSHTQAVTPSIALVSGHLVYTADSLGNVIPDFSSAGYKAGGVAIPTAPVKITLSFIAGDNTAAIQNALNTVAAMTPDANGFRGAVKLNGGTFQIQGSLVINASGVVLRGTGSGTTLKYTGTARNGFLIAGSGGAVTTGTNYTFANTYFPLGSKSFTLTAAPSFAVGDQIVIHRPWTQTWIDAMGMGITGPLGSEGWTPSSGTAFERTVTAKSGNTVTVDIPLMTPFDPAYAIGTAQKITDTGRIQNSGIESLKVFAAFTDPVLANSGVTLNNCKNCWATNILIDSWGNGITVSGGAKFNTIQDCTYQNGYNNGSARPFSFDTDGQMTFFNRCHAISGFEHIVSSQSNTAGPNVWLNVNAVNADSFDGGPHQKWALGDLFDNISGPVSALKVFDAGVEGTGHGWVAGYAVVYNASTDTVTMQMPPVARHYNWMIGGTATVNTTTDMGIIQNVGSMVSPQSLYLQQLQERLGIAAVHNIGY